MSYRLSEKTETLLALYNEKLESFKPIYPGKDFPIYKGPLDRPKMRKLARYGLESYYNQRKKCLNPKDRWFKHYGGKGLTVDYSTREFVGWYLHCRKTFKGKIATVNRIDHGRGYNWENIMMCDSSENSREAMTRNMGKLIDALDTSTNVVAFNDFGDIVSRFPSIREAARALNVSQRLIQFNIRKQYTKLHKRNLYLRVEGDKHGIASLVRDLKKRDKKPTNISGVV